jgi:predicted phosphodiesterase
MATPRPVRRVTRLAVLSDIHGNLAALEAVVADLATRHVDRVVNLGDSVSGPLLPRETAAYLQAQPWIHLAGNHERQLLTLDPAAMGPSDAYAHSQLTPADLAWLTSLPPTQAVGDELFLCHGIPAHDKTYFLETADPSGMRPATASEVDSRLGGITAAVVLCGHTHLPRSVRSSGGQLIVNPGSVGLPAFTDVQPFPHKVETGSPDARYAILKRTAAGWTAELLTVPYDYRPMAALAHERGRPSWEQALCTGYVNAPD